MARAAEISPSESVSSEEMDTAPPLPEIHLAQTERETRAVNRFWYDIYVAEMARHRHEADHASRCLHDPLENKGHLFYASHEGQVVGSVLTTYLRDTRVGCYEDLYRLGALPPAVRAVASVTTRLVVRPDKRRTGLVTRLAVATYVQAVMDGIERTEIDCAEPMVPLFKSLGFRDSVGPALHPEYGRVRVMRLDLVDLAHLSAAGSPLARAYTRVMARA